MTRAGAGALLGAALAAAACGRGADPPPAGRGLVRIAHDSDVFSLDPTAFAESVNHSVLSNMFEGLVGFDRDMALVPGLAVTWSNTEDDTWVLELRRGVRFHDGTPLSAPAVAASLERARTRPESAVRAHLSTVSAIEAASEHRLVLRTSRRDPLLINRLTYVLVARDAKNPDGSFRPVGTGPYAFVRWEPGQRLEMRAFDGYWGGRPAIAQAHFVPVQEGPGAVDVLRRGEVDVLRFLPESLTDEVRALPGMRVVSRPGLTTYYLWFNSLMGGGASPFADRRVRHAVSLALDRQEIVRRLGGSGVPANQFVEKGVFGYVAGLPPLPHDPDRARRLLHEAGHPQGFDVELAHRAGASTQTAAAAVRDMLGAVGIRVALAAPPWSEVVDRWTSAKLPFFYAGWRFESGDAHSFFVDCMKSRDPAAREGSSNPGFSSPELDALVDAHAGIFGEANRLRHYERLTRRALEEMPLVPVYTRDNIYAASRQVVWDPRLDGKLLAAEMSYRAAAGP